MPTNYEEILKKVQIYEEGKVGGRNKMQIQDEHLSEFIRITDEKLKRTIDITWNEARADTLKLAISHMRVARSSMCLKDRKGMLYAINLLETELKKLEG